MKAKDFPLHKLAKLIGGNKAEKKVRKRFHKWVAEVEDLELVRRGRQLWNYLNSGKVSHTEKAVLLLALLYLVSPIDLVSDAIPVLGWLDDLGVATIALNYVTSRMDAKTDAGSGKSGRKAKKKAKGKKKAQKRKPKDLVGMLQGALG